MADPAPTSSFLVYSTAGKYEVLPPAAQAIFGEYIEEGQNHGKRTYKRIPTDSQKGLKDVFVFYWDSRDGKDLQGWWFGDRVGGGQVWARNISSADLPPQKGWRCPVDGPVLQHLVCVPKVRPKQELVKEEEANGEGQQSRAEAETFVLGSHLGLNAPDRIRALCGTFIRRGFNHGRRTYFQKEASCWLYYWDERDGVNFRGWWLGRRVGGADVFGLAKSEGMAPPEKGWLIPHDSKKPSRDVSLRLPGARENHGVNEVEEMEDDEEEVEAAPEDAPENAAMEEDERMSKARELVNSSETVAEKAVQTARKVLAMEGEVFEEGVRAAVELLQDRLGELEKTQGALDRHCAAARKAKVSKAGDGELQLLEERLEQSIGLLQKELPRAREQLSQMDEVSKEERDVAVFEEALPLTMEAVSQAELLAEAAVGQDGASNARKVLTEAMEKISKALERAKKFAPTAQKLALKEFRALQEKCREIEQKLDLAAGNGTQTRKVVEHAPSGVDILDEDEDETLGSTFSLGGKPLKQASIDADVSMEGSAQDAVQRLAAKVEGYETDAQRILETSQVVLHEDSKGANLCLEVLEEQSNSVKKAQQELTGLVAAQKTRQQELGEERDDNSGLLRGLSARLRSLRGRLQQEVSAARRQAAKEQQLAQEKWDVMAAEAAMPATDAAVQQAEDAVQATVLQAGDLDWRRTQMETAMKYPDEFGDEIEKALEETQDLAEKAQAAIDVARGRLDSTEIAFKALPQERKAAAAREVASLRVRLTDGQQRLRPYVRVRTELEHQVQAKEDLKDISASMADLETGLERLDSMLAAPVASLYDAGAVDKAIEPLPGQLSKLFKKLQKRSNEGVGEVAALLGNRLSDLKERGSAASQRLDEMRAKARSLRHSAAGQHLLEKAQAETKMDESWMARIEEVQAPWAGDVEVLPEDQATKALKAADAVAGEVEPQLQSLHAVLQERLVEARRLPDGVFRLKTIDGIQALIVRVDAVALKVTQLKVDTFARRTKMQMQDAVLAVRQAEVEVRRVTEVAKPLAADDLETSAVGSYRQVSSKIEAVQGAAAKACDAAQQLVDKHKMDRLERESPSFHTQLAKLASRLHASKTELAGCCQAGREVDSNRALLKTKKEELRALEETVAAVETLTLPLGDERPSEEAEVVTWRKEWDANQAVAAWIAEAEALEKNPHGALRLAMTRLLIRGRSLQARMREVKAMAGSRREHALCHILVQISGKEEAEVATAMRQAEDVEGPFLKGIEDLPQALCAETVVKCQNAAATAQKRLDQATLFVKQGLSEVNAFLTQDESSRSCKKKLIDLSASLNRTAATLSQYREETESRKKRSAPENASGEPPQKAARI